MSPLPASAAAAGTISGTVRDAVTENPIAGLEVCAFASPEDGNISHCATTDANGEYTITDLLIHGYRIILYGEPLGYKYQVYNEAELGYFGDAVSVESEPITGIDVEMAPFGRIEGTVSEAETGASVDDIRVCAWNLNGRELGDCTHTGTDGTYVITDVRPGEYIIEFLGTGNLLTQAWEHKEIQNWSEGTTLPVQLSEVVTGIDAELAAGARVEGTVRTASDGLPAQGLYACALRPDGEQWRCAQPNREGDYLIEGLETGEYVIEFKPFSAALQFQFWDQGASIADARTLFLAAGTTTTGIDANLVAVTKSELSLPPVGTTPVPGPSALVSSPSVPSVAPSPSIQETSPAPLPQSCRKGFHKKLVGHKVQCVRKAKLHRRRHHPTPHL
jgi:Carboxypeptidase regulatory-like domain